MTDIKAKFQNKLNFRTLQIVMSQSFQPRVTKINLSDHFTLFKQMLGRTELLNSLQSLNKIKSFFLDFKHFLLLYYADILLLVYYLQINLHAYMGATCSEFFSTNIVYDKKI